MDANLSTSIVAKFRCICCSISVESLKLLIGENYKEAVVFNIIKNAFLTSKYLNNISTNLIEKSFGKFELNSYENGEKIMLTGNIIQAKFHIILEGNIIQVLVLIILI